MARALTAPVVVDSEPTDPKHLTLPDRMTLNWLWQNVPIKLWLWFLGIVGGAYSLGVASNVFKSILGW